MDQATYDEVEAECLREAAIREAHNRRRTLAQLTKEAADLSKSLHDSINCGPREDIALDLASDEAGRLLEELAVLVLDSGDAIGYIHEAERKARTTK